MKLALAFLLGFVVLVTQQQHFPYNHQSRVFSPWGFQGYQQINNDLYSYLLARRLAQSGYPTYHQSDSHAGISVGNGFNMPQPAPSQEKLLDIEGGINTFGRDPFDQVNPRFLLNYATTAGNSYYNPLLRTVYLFTSSVITTTAVTTCIPATHFVAASSTIVCRKRREVLEVLKQINNAGTSQKPSIAPSPVEEINVQPTADPTSDSAQAALLSSLDEKHTEDSSDSPADSPRTKRLLGGLFYSTTTLTSYVLSTVSSTRTLSTLVTTSALSCRPSNYIVC